MSDSGASHIRVIDLEPFRRSRDRSHSLVRDIQQACETLGFLVVTGHGVDPAAIDEMCRVTRSFFERSEGEKVAIDHPVVGYRPLASGSLSKTAGTDAPGDLCETLRFNPRVPGATPTPPFPRTPPALAATWQAWFIEMRKLADLVMAAFARALGLTDDWFEPYFADDSSSVIANYYPSLNRPALPGQLRRGAHTDFGVLTVLYQTSDHGGLEVRHPTSSSWIPVPFEPNTFVLNIGDLMERWTNGRWVSTLHRVVNPAIADGGSAVEPRASGERGAEARISLAYFHRPDPAATIAAIESCIPESSESQYPPVVAGEWMAAKQRLIYPTGT